LLIDAPLKLALCQLTEFSVAHLSTNFIADCM